MEAEAEAEAEALASLITLDLDDNPLLVINSSYLLKL